MSRRKFLPLLITVFIGLGLLVSIGMVQRTPVQAASTQDTVTDQIERAKMAHDALYTYQNDDGGFSSFSGGANLADSSIGGTIDAVLALAATGERPNDALLQYIYENLHELQMYAQTTGGQAGKAVLAITAIHADPANFGGIDFLPTLLGHFDVDTGSADTTSFNHALAMLGVAAARADMPADAADFLIGKQAVDGSWDDDFGTVSNTDTTAVAIMALVAAGLGLDNADVMAARGWMARAQLPTGGFEYGVGFGENASSTGLAVQALKALGEDFYTSGGTWDAGTDATPLDALASYQNMATGLFQADFGSGPFDDFFATTQALVGLTGRTFPLPARTVAAQHAFDCLLNLRDDDNGGWPQFAFGTGDGDAAGTSRAILAMHITNQDIFDAAWSTPIDPLEAMEDLTPAYLATGRGGPVGIVLQGAARAGADVTNFAGEDLVLAMSGYLSPTGEYENTAFGPFAHAEAMIGLLDSGNPVDPSAQMWLEDQQAADGTFGGPESTGISMQVLSRLGVAVNENTMDSLRAAIEPDGGWGFGFGDSNPSTTAEAVQGIYAYGENPYGLTWSTVISGSITNPGDTILAQQAESGCMIGFTGTDDSFYTTDAIMMFMLENGVLDANFTATPQMGAHTLAVDFTDWSTGNPSSYLWDFGNGETSTAANPTATFTPGVYEVSLTVTNYSGTDTETKSSYIVVEPMNPIFLPILNQ